MEVIASILQSMGFNQWAMVVFALSIVIDITPKIKFNPIRSLLGYIGKCFNRAIEDEIKSFKSEVDQRFNELKQEQLEQRATLNKIAQDQENKEFSKLKWDIINFENSILNGIKHSRSEYRHILDCASKYMRMVESDDNSIVISEEDVQHIKEAIEFIRKHYNDNRQIQSSMF